MSETLQQLVERLCPEGVEFVQIGNICQSLKKGTLTTKELTENGYPVINSGRTLYGYYSHYNNEGDAITIAARGEYAGWITYCPDRFWAGGLCYPYRSVDENRLCTKFLYYALKSSEQFIMDTLVARGSIPALNKSDLDAFEIPVPPLEVQRKIVEVLDNFSELTAELTARQKQYEYYRDNLLSFSNINRGGAK